MTTLFTTQHSYPATRNALSAPRQLRFTASDQLLTASNLALMPLHRGQFLRVASHVYQGKETVALFHKHALVARLPKILAPQVLRLMQKGQEYYAEIERVDKLAGLAPHALALVLKSNAQG